jgi:hypothetical protein
LLLRQVDEWVDEELPRLNRAILNGSIRPGALAGQARNVLLPRLPAIWRLDPMQARKLVVRLGFLGASLARHYQEWTPGGKERPERAFDGLLAGSEQMPFRGYFAALAAHTGDGHYGRDSYASLVRWNVGTIEVRHGHELLTVLPGVFDDGRIRTYTGTPGEERFFLLVKQSEAIERAVNDVLEPLAAEGVHLLGREAATSVRLGTDLMMALRRLFLDFAALPAERSMPPEHFMDVFRQFAVHWTDGDIPPSGALDPEALKRDFLLGIGIAGYDRHVRRLFPALLDGERACLDRLMASPPLPHRLLASLDLDAADLRTASEAELHRLLGEHPVVADWYRLLTAHARAAAAHLMLSKKFLFKPQRRRDEEGVGDQRLVSNRAGTTGMNEGYLDKLTRARQDHPLAPLRIALTGSGESPENGTACGVRSHSEPISVARVG